VVVARVWSLTVNGSSLFRSGLHLNRIGSFLVILYNPVGCFCRDEVSFLLVLGHKNPSWSVMKISEDCLEIVYFFGRHYALCSDPVLGYTMLSLNYNKYLCNVCIYIYRNDKSSTCNNFNDLLS